ncbi:hypothetical protein EPN83_01655 [Patescibacteria group bacterium]|nr:MAG: hypothetical protein EPN83_01655 [Patescibacteria group bacterium]
MKIQSAFKGILAALSLLALYFAVVTLISGWAFALEQFTRFWYFIVSLTLGFGIQIGLYSYLKNAIRRSVPKGAVVASGTTSTVATLSCCAHYLANILPVVGIAGLISFIGQYQIELFWVGLAANIFGIWYITNKIRKFLRA